MMSDVLSLGNLAEAGARSLLMAGCVGLALAALRVRNVAAQKLAWTFVLAGAIAMPFANPWAKAHVDTLPAVLRVDAARLAAISETVRPHPAVVAEPAGVSAASESVSVSEQHSTSDPVEMHLDFAPQQSPAPAAPHRAPTWPEIAFILYSAAAALLLARVFYGLVAALRLWVAARPLTCEGFPQLRVRISAEIASPVTIGSGVLLPAFSARWDDRKLRIVLAHESSHVRQGDFYIQLCAEFYAAIFWFSPLGWWLRRKLCALNETLSDGAAVREASSHASYAQMLLEFAAMPRTNPIGVAMARPGSVSARIERLLDESRFRQAFAASPLRKLVGGMLLPVMLCAAAALLQLSAHAAMQQPATAPPPAHTQPEAATAPQHANVPQHATAPQVVPVDPAPAVEASPEVAPVPPTGSVDGVPPVPQTPQVGSLPPLPPTPQHGVLTHISTMNQEGRSSHAESETKDGHSTFAYSSHWGDDDDYYMLASKDWNNTSCCNWMGPHRNEIEKARTLAKGDFLWFGHDGKSYIVDDPQTIAQLKQMYGPMGELGRKQKELGQQQRDLGEQQRELGRQMREQTRIEKPDISKEMADVNAAVEALKAEKSTSISADKLAEMQAKLAALQDKLGTMQGKLGARMGEIGAQQGRLGDMQGRLGQEQGRLGEEQGRLAREADRKIRSVIDESLKNGKARPVQ
jgi:beta-lactamase regulating signal transducer with metallopeptidase domain